MLKRPSNKPRAEIVRLAQTAIDANGGPTRARVWYKFDCGACGSREIVSQPNVLPSSADCSVCGAVTTILGGGFALEVRRSASVDWDRPVPKTLVVRKRYESDRGDA